LRVIPEDYTKYGDGACDIEPLADFYKTTVRQIAAALEVPQRIVCKAPSPDLWPDQSAKDELGADYDLLDLVLWGIEHWWKTEEIAQALNISEEFIRKIHGRWRSAEHKRRTPLTPKLFLRTVGHDFRLPYTP
jgi:NAD+ synthase